MKKVLVGTCVLAMTAFGVTNASAAPISSARAFAYGIKASLAGTELVDEEPNASSEFPPGSSEENDVATVDLEELALEGVGIQQAETREESTIVPALVPSDDGGGGGVGINQIGGGGGDDGGLLGLDLEEILNLGGEDGGGDSGIDEGGIEGFGGPDDEDIEIPLVNARGFSSINLTGVAPEEGEGGEGGGGFFGIDLDDFLGGGGGGGGIVPGVGTESVDDGTVQAQQVPGVDEVLGDATGEELQQIVFDALLRLGVVESEAVAVCTGSGPPRFDVASRIVDDDGSDLEIGEVLNDAIESVLEVGEDLLPGLIETRQGVAGTTADGGVFIDALRITVGEDLGLGGGGGGGIVPEVGTESVDDGTVQAQQVGEDEPLLEIILGHSEVSGVVCAEQAAPAAPLVPAGDDRTLPVTGGALGVLPAVLGLGLAGGALAAGRVALRSRRENTL